MTAYELFKNLMVMAASDDHLKEEEVTFLSQRANRWGITEPQFAEALRFAVSPAAVITIPQTVGERQQLMREMVRMMGADGDLAEIEKKLFAIAAGTMQLSEAEVNQIIDDVVKPTGGKRE